MSKITITKETPEVAQDWYFTFGFGQEHQNGYTIIHGTSSEARDEMFRRYDNKWSMQYSSAEAAGVERFNLRKVK